MQWLVPPHNALWSSFELMAGSSSRGHMNYQVSRVGLRGKKTTSRCATRREDTIDKSARLFRLLKGQILVVFGSKGAN